MTSAFKRTSTCLIALAALVISATAAPGKKVLMWKAVNGSHVVYLLGSIHLGSKKMYPLPKVIENAFSRCTNMVVEIDISHLDMSKLAGLMMTKGMYQDDDNLWKHLAKDTADRTKKFFDKYGMPDEVVGKCKPWLAYMMMQVAPMQKAGMQADLGIDKYFMDRANAAKPPKKIEQAESVDFQLNLLSSISDSLAEKLIAYQLDQAEKSKSEDITVEKLWMQGNAEAMDGELTKFPPFIAPFMRKLLQDRNPHMTDVAEKHLKSGGPCFFVVGAAHLVGFEGVVAQLQDRGYKVFQMSEN